MERTQALAHTIASICLAAGCAPAATAPPPATAAEPAAPAAAPAPEPAAVPSAESASSPSTEPAWERPSMPMPDKAADLLGALASSHGAAFVAGTNVQIATCNGFASEETGSARIRFQTGELVIAVTSATIGEAELAKARESAGYQLLERKAPGPDVFIDREGKGAETVSHYLVSMRARREWALLQATYVGEPTYELDEAVAAYLSAAAVDAWDAVFEPGPPWQLDPGPFRVIGHRNGKWFYGKQLEGGVNAVVLRHDRARHGPDALAKFCSEAEWRRVKMGRLMGCIRSVPDDPDDPDDTGMLALRLQAQGPILEINVVAKGATQKTLAALRKEVERWLKSYDHTSYRIASVDAVGLRDYETEALPIGLALDPDEALWLRREGSVIRVVDGNGAKLLEQAIPARSEVYAADLVGDAIQEIVVRITHGDDPRAFPISWDIYRVDADKLTRIAQIAESNTSDAEGSALGDPRDHFTNHISMPRKGLLRVKTIVFWDRGPNPPPGAPRRRGQSYELHYDEKRARFVKR